MTEQTQSPEVAEVWRLFRETSERFRETDARFKETSEHLRRLEGLFTSQWGKLIEALVKPNALRLFQERGIKVRHTYQRAVAQLNGDNMEVDLLLENDNEVVIVEVKTTLRVGDVNDFLDDLARFPAFFPKFKYYRIYGAVASVNTDENADRYAYKQGLFVLGLAGEGMVEIKNDAKFIPRNFGTIAEQA